MTSLKKAIIVLAMAAMVFASCASEGNNGTSGTLKEEHDAASDARNRMEQML
jgi:hypothetical protein